MISELVSEQPRAIVIHGIAGDLAWRKLVPSLCNLYRGHALPRRFAILGLDAKPISHENLLLRLRDGVERFSSARGCP